MKERNSLRVPGLQTDQANTSAECFNDVYNMFHEYYVQKLSLLCPFLEVLEGIRHLPPHVAVTFVAWLTLFFLNWIPQKGAYS